MVVVPAGEFMMGSPANEKGRNHNEDDGNGRQHKVTIARPFAVSKYDVTFADWDACVSVGGCPQLDPAADAGWGRGLQPVIFLSWDDAQAYVAWLSRMSGKGYRLLTEAEWEYAARAGSITAYFWDSTRSAKGTPTVMGAAASGTSRPHRSDRSSPMRSAFTIWRVTCGSGWRIAITRTTMGRRLMVRRGRLASVSPVSSAAVPGGTIQSTSGRPPACGALPTSGTATWVSGSAERLVLDFLVSLLLGGLGAPPKHAARRYHSINLPVEQRAGDAITKDPAEEILFVEPGEEILRRHMLWFHLPIVDLEMKAKALGSLSACLNPLARSARAGPAAAAGNAFCQRR